MDRFGLTIFFTNGFNRADTPGTKAIAEEQEGILGRSFGGCQINGFFAVNND